MLGRSLVVGRPAAMLLLHRGATVTLCHSKTENAAGLAREADILVAAAGRRESVGAAYFRAGQTVIDVGIHYNEETQKLCGDVALAEADGVVRAVTPVPGGVGALTTVLAAHTAKSRGTPDKINSIASIDKGHTRFCRAEMPSYCVKALENTQSILCGLFPCLRAFQLRQNCFASDSLGFSRDFVLLTQAGCRPPRTKGQKHRKDWPSDVCALVNRRFRKHMTE